MARPEDPKHEFTARVALFFETLGGTRTMGLIYGWLTICEPAHQSITDMARELAVSKASISTVIRQLELAQMVERVPVSGSRQHHYRLRSGGWAQILHSRVARLAPGAEAADFGLEHIHGLQAHQVERLHEMRDFFLFLEDDFGDEMVRRWEEYRKDTQSRRAENRHA
jgi:DNA-binding MarR family transcriptional regulator